MTHVSRRSFLSTAGAVPLVLLMEKVGLGQTSTPKVRYECRTPQGIAMLTIYAAGVKAMRALPDGDPRSWVFQWYTHQVVDATTKDAAINQIYPNAGDPNRAVAEAMWNTCQAHNGEDENFFLPWHRCFLFFFEQIIAQLSGHSEFALPYWNYSTSDQTVRGVIPPQFTLKDDATLGSLFDGLRNPGVNDGLPIQNTPIAQQLGSDPLSLDVLGEGNYGPQGADAGFNSNLDNVLHGNVHVMVGAPNNMGAIPDAAQDPIFWMHHCNIDRLWASWSAAGGVTPQISQSFTFVDGQGNQKVVDTKDYLDITSLNYSYDRLEPVPGSPSPAPSAAPASTLLAAGANFILAATRSESALEPAVTPHPASMTARLASLAPRKRVFVVLRELKANSPPGVLYNAYLDLPANPTPQQFTDHFVGTINFFGLSHGGAGHGMPMAQRAAGRGPEKFVSFDVTSKIRALGVNKTLQQKPVITIIPRGNPRENSNPVIGKVEIVVQ